MMAGMASVHASAILTGARAVLIRGPSGSGKSLLAFKILQAADAGLLPFARLVADDRAHVQACNGRLLVRPAEALKGLLEIRGLGVRRIAFEPLAVVGLAVDLAVEDAERLPDPSVQAATIDGVRVARLAVAPGIDPLPLVLAQARTAGLR